MTTRTSVSTFYNDVNDWLSVGGDLDLALDLTGQDHATTIAKLREHGVTHVLDLRSEWDDLATWAANGLPAENYCHAPIIDSWRHAPAESWYEAVEDFVKEFWLNSLEGDRLYVHCHMGINRAPSAAMLALLTTNPEMHPYEAFLMIREVRPAAGLVYADVVGARHIAMSSGNLAALDGFVQMINDYWSPEMIREVNRGIAYYRSIEGGTLVVDL